MSVTPKHRRGRRVLASVTGIACGLTLAWCLGFAWFVHRSVHPGAEPPHADGIVVLTGGADRIETAFRLLEQGKAQLLLVSGVPAAGLPTITHRLGIDPAPIAPRVTLGRTATSTLGNAEETAAWVRAHNLRTLIVVTAAYHMPRALTEMSRALPGVTLYPMPVVPPALREMDDLGTIRLLAGEYTKWLASEIGLSHLARARDSG